MEFERLAQRPPTKAELAVALRIADKRSVWAEGLRPEASPLLAVALSCALGTKILFITPSTRLIEQRQTRLGTRGPCQVLAQACKDPTRHASPKGITVWTSPDALDPAQLARTFGKAGPDAVFIEDAHACTSQSFSYRPSLGELGQLLAHWPDALVMASAPPHNQKLKTHVAMQLGLQIWSTKKSLSEAIVTEPSVLGNKSLTLHVEAREDAALEAIVGPLPRPALVLCGTPAQADEIYSRLDANQVPVHRFHSGLSASERARELVHFALPGRRAVMVAVSAFGPSSGFAGYDSSPVPESFGLGYTRSDLRSVVHLCAPCSLQQYTQELSLLSPDERESKAALMLFDPAHLKLNSALLARKRPSVDVLDSTMSVFLENQKGHWIEESALEEAANSSSRQLSLVLSFLEDAGVIERDQDMARTLADVDELDSRVARLKAAFVALNNGDLERLKRVEMYALGTSCRMNTLSRLVSEVEESKACGSCDVCRPSNKTVSEKPTTESPEVARSVGRGRRRSPARRENSLRDHEKELDANELPMASAPTSEIG